MKKIRVFVLVLLTVLTIVSMSFLAEAEVTITSKGRAKVVSEPNGVVTFECDNSDSVTCSITIKPAVD